MKKAKELDFISTEEYTKEDVKKCQKRLLEMMGQVDKIFKKHGIRYIILYGTLLGAVRHQEFIPWDDDLDIGVHEEEYERAIAILKKELSDDIFIQDKTTEEDYDCEWAKLRDVNSDTLALIWPQDNRWEHRGICLDIYKMHSQRFRAKQEVKYRIELLKKQRKITQKTRRLLGIIKYSLFGMYYKITGNGKMEVLSTNVMREKDMFPLKKYKFENFELWGPNNYDVFLTNVYKDYMKIPPLEARKPHYGWIKYNTKGN